MVNANHRRRYICLFIAVLTLYVVYLVYEKVVAYDSSGRVAIARHHKAMLNNKDLHINALILGGSNAAFGISAELLSRYTGYHFYNLALMNEGFSSDNYFKFVQSATSTIDRNRIKLIVFSSIRTIKKLSAEEDATRDVTGRSLSLIEPSESFLKFLSSQIKERSGSIDRAVKNYAYKIYKVRGEYGDFDFTDFSCASTIAIENFSPPAVDFAVAYLMQKKAAYTKLFSNAEFMVVIPAEFDENPPLKNRYIVDLTAKLKNAGIVFVVQPSHQNRNLVCDAAFHPNAIGRALLTKNLADSLQALNSQGSL